MGTTLTAPIRAGKTYKLVFSNHIESTGTVLVTAGFVPKHGHQVPAARSIFIAPNGVDEISVEVPTFSTVRRLSVTVSLDANESGTLEVFDGSNEHTNEDLLRRLRSKCRSIHEETANPAGRSIAAVARVERSSARRWWR